MLAELRECEFQLIRYVPDEVKGEFVNVGVLLRERATPARSELRFTRDWARVRCIDPGADVAMLEALESDLRVQMSAGPEFMKLLDESLSNIVQMTMPKACLADTFQTQMERLMRLYVEAQKQPGPAKRSGRAAILGEMRRAFEREGVWELMRKRISAAQYTQPGDPLKIDCGYRPNGTIRLFQAVSLENDVEAAKGLAFSAPYLRQGMQRVEKASLELTAIVEPLRALAEDAVEEYRFGVETMEREQVRVLTVADLGRVAKAARAELPV